MTCSMSAAAHPNLIICLLPLQIEHDSRRHMGELTLPERGLLAEHVNSIYNYLMIIVHVKMTSVFIQMR